MVLKAATASNGVGSKANSLFPGYKWHLTSDVDPIVTPGLSDAEVDYVEVIQKFDGSGGFNVKFMLGGFEYHIHFKGMFNEAKRSDLSSKVGLIKVKIAGDRRIYESTNQAYYRLHELATHPDVAGWPNHKGLLSKLSKAWTAYKQG